MTVMSEAYTFNVSDGVESTIMIGFSSSKITNWESHKSDETWVINDQADVLAKEVTRLRFLLLLEKWHRERGPASSISTIVRCDSYQQIINMGKRALPLILARLEQEGDKPDHWFIALESITGENPIPENAYGNMLKMAEAWFSWAERNDVR